MVGGWLGDEDGREEEKKEKKREVDLGMCRCGRLRQREDERESRREGTEARSSKRRS